MNAALLRDGAERPDGFWIRCTVRRALSRLQVFGIVLFLPVAMFAGLYWTAELGDKAGTGTLAGAAAGTVAAAALLHVLLGALLDLVCETSRFGALLQREIQFYFHTPVPYLVMVLFTLAAGIFFDFSLAGYPAITYRYAFGPISFFLIFLIPLLTIRSFAEEKSSGTVEPLLTAPISEAQVVAGKFFGAMVFFAAMLLPTVAYFAVLRFIGAGASLAKPDGGPVVAGYCGLLLFGAFHVAIGIFASTLTQDSVLGAFLAFVMILFFWAVEPIMESLNVISSPGWTEAALYISPTKHLEPFLKGVLAPLDAIHFVTFTLFFLFLAARSIEYRKWR